MKKTALSLLLTVPLLLSTLPGTCEAYHSTNNPYQTVSTSYPVMSSDNLHQYPNIIDQIDAATLQELTAVSSVITSCYYDSIFDPKNATNEELYDIAISLMLWKQVPSTTNVEIGPDYNPHTLWQVKLKDINDVLYRNIGRTLDPAPYIETQNLSDWEIYEKYANDTHNQFIYNETLCVVFPNIGIHSPYTEIDGIYDLGNGKFLADIAVYDPYEDSIQGYVAEVLQKVNGRFQLQRYYPMSYQTFTIPLEVFASPTTSPVLVNGKQVEFEAYNIQDNNYFKLRDIAQAITGTEKQFNVTWDGSKNAINLLSGQPYVSAGGELLPGDGTAKDALPSTATIYQDSNAISLTAYTINGNNYFKLRDLAQIFDFQVSWDAAAQCVRIDTTSFYQLP